MTKINSREEQLFKRNTSAQRPYTTNQGAPGIVFDGRKASQGANQMLKISQFRSEDHLDYHKNPQPDDDTTFQTGNLGTVPNEHDNIERSTPKK